ncbi:MAG: ferrous iron transport protein A [Ruminococcus sp.]|nr:ferrous iron transport protein A [Ruminococcus sp.]
MKNIKKLTEMGDGEKAVISAVTGDRRYLSRITSIGLNVGCKIEMLQNVTGRPLLVYGRDTMIALSRSESERISVEVTA